MEAMVGEGFLYRENRYCEEGVEVTGSVDRSRCGEEQ